MASLAAGWRSWESGGQSAAQWAELTRRAMATEDPLAVERALTALGRRLGVWRGAGGHQEVTDAVRELARPGHAWRTRIDARNLLPALEVLIDAGDAAAILRVTAEQSGRAAEPHWTGARTVAESFAPISAEFPSGCVASAAIASHVPPGSYLADCGAGEQLVVLPP